MSSERRLSSVVKHVGVADIEDMAGGRSRGGQGPSTHACACGNSSAGPQRAEHSLREIHGLALHAADAKVGHIGNLLGMLGSGKPPVSAGVQVLALDVNVILTPQPAYFIRDSPYKICRRGVRENGFKVYTYAGRSGRGQGDRRRRAPTRKHPGPRRVLHAPSRGVEAV